MNTCDIYGLKRTGCAGCPLGSGIENELANEPKQLQALNDSVENFQKVINEVFMPTVQKAVQIVQKMADIVFEYINLYPNKRVVYLAMHHPKERVRKKNLRRIQKWIESEIKK